MTKQPLTGQPHAQRQHESDAASQNKDHERVYALLAGQASAAASTSGVPMSVPAWLHDPGIVNEPAGIPRWTPAACPHQALADRPGPDLARCPTCGAAIRLRRAVPPGHGGTPPGGASAAAGPPARTSGSRISLIPAARGSRMAAVRSFGVRKRISLRWHP